MSSNLAAFQKRIVGVAGQRIAWSTSDVERIARHFGVDLGKADLPHPAASRRASGIDLHLRDASSDDRTYTFIASTAEIDRMGDVINQSGWDLSAFRRNPVILFAHDSGSLPVAKATSVGAHDGKLMVSVKFAQTGLARGVAAMVNSGHLRATSVGFRPTKFDFARSASRSGGIDFAQQELLEVSIVPVPANASCLLVGITGSDDKSIFDSLNTKAKKRGQRLLDLELIRQRDAKAQRDRKNDMLIELAKVKARARR